MLKSIVPVRLCLKETLDNEVQIYRMRWVMIVCCWLQGSLHLLEGSPQIAFAFGYLDSFAQVLKSVQVRHGRPSYFKGSEVSEWNSHLD